ncbi:MAG: hypothetical protein ACXAD7_09620 [Candidatus Kariarchaeaceae archaeon]
MVIRIPQQTISWLLEDDNAPVRNLAKQFLLDENITTSEKDEVNQYLPIKKLLSLVKPNGSWSTSIKPYHKYKGDYWQLIFLCDLHANPADNRIQKACENILSYQLPDGTFPAYPKQKRTSIICLTANILRSLVSFGYYDDENVQNGITTITKHINHHNGIFCPAMAYSLLSDCQMALTKVLAMYGVLEKRNINSEIKSALDIIIKKITENRIYQYLPSGTKEFKEMSKNLKLKEIKQLKMKMQSDPENMHLGVEKRGWKSFGFPQSYTSDILETLYYIANMEVGMNDEYSEALKCVLRKMTANGVWINENNFRNPMLVEIEKKKDESKWITYRACYVLKHYNQVSI